MDIDFAKHGGLVPAVVQDSVTQKVLMVGFMNEEALQKTIAEKKVTFFSRTKNRLWTKGETSGLFLNVEDLLIDCDKDTILVKAKPVGVVCHTGADTCFFEKNEANHLTFIADLENLIHKRKINPDSSSYTHSLFKKGINKVAQKVGEEAVELVIEAIDGSRPDLLKNEAADLLFHYLVLLSAKDLTLKDVVEVLKERNKK
ncbi:MAG: bifunctional phosphoribosyl-AMP cyclohydrolase/phosphoribosyl-ATP diphosphatase HisIE [Cytophagales bacterium]